jgi:uncharacterized integral membrane protein
VYHLDHDPGRTAGDAEPAHATGNARTIVAFVVGAVLAAMVVAFLLQNRDRVDVSLLGWSGTARLWLVLLLTFVVGVVVGMVIVPAARASRARRRR